MFKQSLLTKAGLAYCIVLNGIYFNNLSNDFKKDSQNILKNYKN